MAIKRNSTSRWLTILAASVASFGLRLAPGQVPSPDPDPKRCEHGWRWSKGGGVYGTAGHTSGSAGAGAQNTLTGYLKGGGWRLLPGLKAGAFGIALNLQATHYGAAPGALPKARQEASSRYLAANVLQYKRCRLTLSLQGTRGNTSSHSVGRAPKETQFRGGNLTGEYRLSPRSRFSVSLYGSLGKKWTSSSRSWSGFVGFRARFESKESNEPAAPACGL